MPRCITKHSKLYSAERYPRSLAYIPDEGGNIWADESEPVATVASRPARLTARGTRRDIRAKTAQTPKPRAQLG